MGYEKRFLLAVVAQFCGVTLAIIGCGGIFYGTSPNWTSGKMIGGIVIPFVIAYSLFGIGFFFFLSNYKDEAICEKTYTWFVPLCLYLNAILLSIMVAASGGVKQSLFCPLFLAMPVMAVVFVPRYWPKVLHIQVVTVITTVITLVGYLVVYWYFSPIPEEAPQRLYSFCENFILVGSVVLTVVISLRIPLLR